MRLVEAKQFVARFIEGVYSPEEYEAFLRWLKEATTSDLDAIADEHEALYQYWPVSPEGPTSHWIEQLERKLDMSAADEMGDEDVSGANEMGDEMDEVIEAPVIDIGRGGFNREGLRKTAGSGKRWIAAASVIVVLAVGALVYVKQMESKSAHSHTDIAALTKVFLNPRGGEQKLMTLADGSKVWLNSASTLRYPESFDGPERVVELSGEAYFEVKKNPNSPFRVLIRDAEVEVLGTSFNVMAYDGDVFSRTTLVEGTIKIESGGRDMTLHPGQQAEVENSLSGGTASIKLIESIDPMAIVAWKDGVLKFEKEELHSVMRVLARAYNVDVQYDPKVPSTIRITGIFERKNGLANNLEQLESFSKVHFKYDGKTVMVSI